MTFALRRFQLAGDRVVKTGVAIFLTAWICQLLNWPPVFAVITAIVTIEPTVSASIKKGIIRFPASAIGSAYAVIFISIFGDSPLSYTLAAVFTIATCFKLNLYSGLLVATLTSVAMVEVIHGNLLIAFFIRLGTTTIGLLVSTLVNMFLLPPDYTNEIAKNVQGISKRTGTVFIKVFKDVLENRHDEDIKDRNMIAALDNKIHQTETLVRFQKDETKFHPLVGNEKLLFVHAQEQLIKLRLINYHLDNLINTPLKATSWTESERGMILEAIHSLAHSLRNTSAYDAVKHQEQFRRMMELFWEGNEEITKKYDQRPPHFPPELVIMYELLSIYNLVRKIYQRTEPKE